MAAPSDAVTWVEVSQAALRENVRTIKKHIGRGALYVVIKSNAYGHGAAAVSSCIGTMRDISGFAVATLDEALALPRTIRKQIIVLSIWQRDAKKITLAARRNIPLPLYDVAAARYLDSLGKKLHRKIPVQLKIDTGTMRLGLRWDDAASINKILSFKHIVCTGVFSHFADSENKNLSFTNLQTERFDAALSVAKTSTGNRSILLTHIACTAAALQGKQYHYDAIRAGIGIYGLWPSNDIRTLMGNKMALTPSVSWKTRIIQIKTLKRGETVGYGLSYRAPAETRLAVLPVGYWDGYDRRLSNQSSVLIGGARAPIRGRICMNLMMAEIPAGVQARINDEVVLLGKQGKSDVTAEELARLTGTINYEIVTRINPLIPRFVI